ncbi:MAG: nickel-responsive transcriptional regulator NikR [Candidatus Aureabacteria bacterium]|nr:nickel-responsive transcriptional regulator NikR [Candidatus Auribacterota bacterium]
MVEVIRFGVSLEKDLLDAFDKCIKRREYTNRSEAIRDLIRNELVKEQWNEEKEIAGAIILIYDHHKRDFVEKLMNIQHDFHKVIISTQHVHLDHDNCLEIIAVKGKTQSVQKLANILASVKGVKHTSLSMSSTGKGL